MGLLDGKRAVVTGSGRGVGRAYALALAAEGARVVVNSTTPAMVDAVVAEIRAAGGEALACPASVADWEGAERLIGAAVEAWGGLDILVNNAGITRERMVFNMTEEEFQASARVDAFGTFACMRFAAGLMRQQRGGRIVNTGDGSALHGYLGGTGVGAAKGGVHSMTMTAAIEMRRYGVTVNCVIPNGYTRMHDPLIRKEVEVARSRDPEHAPTFEALVAERARPEEITGLLVYLCSDEADWITGQIFSMHRNKISLWSRPVEKVQWRNPAGIDLAQVRTQAREVFGDELEAVGIASPWVAEGAPSDRGPA